MKDIHNNDLSNKSIGKLLFSMSFPAIIAQIINVLYNMVDRMYIGHIPDIGAKALTGVGVTLPLIIVISAFAALISAGGAARAAIMMGRGDKEAANRILGSCTTVLLVMAFALTVLVIAFGKKLMLLFGGSEDTIGSAMDYMVIYACGTLFVQLVLGLNPFITAQGFSKVSMITVSVGAVANILLDPLFIFGLGMGVKGAALATILSQAISAIWVIKFLTGPKSVLKIKREYMKIDPKVFLPCLALGISPFIIQSTESVLTITFNSSLQKFGGDMAVGAMTILSSVMQFTMLPLVGLSQGAQPIISFNYGAGNGQRVKKTFMLLIKATIVYSTGMWLLAMLLPEMFIGVFTNNTELSRMAVTALRTYMAVSFLFGIQISCQQTFIALGNAKVSIFLALLRKIILLVPLIYILPLYFEDKVFAVFLAEPVADFVAVTITGLMFAVQFKKVIRKLDGIGM